MGIFFQRIKSILNLLTYFGNSNLHSTVFLNKTSGSSNGKHPHNIIYKIIPHDHTSILNPSYFFDDFQEFYQ